MEAAEAKTAVATPALPRRQRILAHVLADGLVIAVVLGWWAMAKTLPANILPTPAAVAEQLWLLFTDKVYLGHTAVSVVRVLLSVTLALLLGGLIAFWPLNHPWARAIVHERIKPFFNSFPSIGWAILAVIWFRVSDFTAIFVQVAILIPFCLINFTQGLRDLDAELIEMGRSFTRSKRLVFTKLIVPLLLPYAVASLRIAYGVCWKIALVSELFGADTGLGYVMLQAQIVSDVTVVIATCLAIVLLFGAGDYFVLRPLSRMVAR